MLLKNNEVYSRKKTELDYISNSVLGYCCSNDPKDTGIFVFEPTAPRLRESNVVLSFENVQQRAEVLKDALNINHELQFEIMIYASNHPVIKNRVFKFKG